MVNIHQEHTSSFSFFRGLTLNCSKQTRLGLIQIMMRFYASSSKSQPVALRMKNSWLSVRCIFQIARDVIYSILQQSVRRQRVFSPSGNIPLVSFKNRLYKGDANSKDCDNNAQAETPSVINSLSGPDNNSCCNTSEVTGMGKAHLKNIV